MDAEHILLRGAIHSTDREDNHRDQAAQHRPRVHHLYAQPCGCGPVMEANSSLQTVLVRTGLHGHKETITKTYVTDLKLREREKEGW